MSLIDRSCPIASGVIDSGKTTVSFSGSTGSVAGQLLSELLGVLLFLRADDDELRVGHRRTSIAIFVCSAMRWASGSTTRRSPRS